MTAVERFEVGFKAGQVWLESSTGIMRTITEVLTDGRICYASCYPSADHANKRKLVGPQMECIQDWHDDYRLLTPDAPNCDLLTALEEQIEALTARVDALERPAEAEPTADVPRDCTGREWRPEAGWVVQPESCTCQWRYDGAKWVCFVEGQCGWQIGEVITGGLLARYCRILWPIADGTEGKR
jgi:hypothetical protein